MLSAALIAGLVRSNGSLTSLSLADNSLGSAGASAIIGAVKGSRCATLDLSGNDVGQEGTFAEATRPSLASVPSLAAAEG